MSQIEPRSGIEYNWVTGETGWGVGMNANLARLGRFAFHLAVLDRDLNTPPAVPTHGDTYIVGGLATGDWEGHDDAIAIWDETEGETGEWVFGAPSNGWTAVILDERKLAVFIAGEGWSTGADLGLT